ncbi:hypothetical protein [Streptomyces sp. NPDC090445]|uniref:hypothetical protein n=1 Tax=Streptomyces sp. NPDC090445 TaxID=3365963 RepID=UPI003821192F
MTINFKRIFVKDDGDGWLDGAGEICFRLGVGGANEISGGPVAVNSGESHSVNQMVTWIHPEEEVLVVYGEVWEEDSGGTGANDHAGTFQDTFRIKHLASKHSMHSRRLKAQGVDVTVHYEIFVE